MTFQFANIRSSIIGITPDVFTKTDFEFIFFLHFPSALKRQSGLDKLLT